MDTIPSADYVLGFDAQWSGMPITLCPYDRVFEYVRWLEWRRGWLGGAAAEDGSRVHYDDGELVRPTRGMMETAANEPSEASFAPPLPPPAGFLGLDVGEGSDFSPPKENPWRDDRQDPPEGDWDSEEWKKGPQG